MSTQQTARLRDHASTRSRSTSRHASNSTIANANYNALEATFRYESNASQLLPSHTYAKFNPPHHSQLDGPAAVDGQIEQPNLGPLLSADSQRRMQVAVTVSS